MIYADSSALVSLYSPDNNTASAVVLFTGISPPILFTQLHQLEITNALELRQFRQQITAPQGAASAQAITADLLSRTLRTVSLNWPLVFSSALALSKRHSRVMGTRSLDILYVAAALETGARMFITFDKRQADLARAEGLQVLGS